MIIQFEFSKCIFKFIKIALPRKILKKHESSLLTTKAPQKVNCVKHIERARLMQCVRLFFMGSNPASICFLMI